MAGSRSYGDAVAHSFGLTGAPSMRTRSLRSSQVAVNRLSITPAEYGLSPRIPAEDTFILALYLTDLPYHELWSGGRLAVAQGYRAGSMRLVNLVDDYSARISHSHEALAFYIPRAALDETADRLGCPRLDRLVCAPGATDPVVQHLASALLPAFAAADGADQLFVDQVIGAMLVHLLRHHQGPAGKAIFPAKGGLPPYQVERAKEFLAANCDRDVSLVEVAAYCGFSRGHFAKAFRTSVGLTPHRWHQRSRVEKAKDLLARTDQTVAEIALACGFADQSHFTRVFGRLTGTGPAGWRRSQQGG